MSVTIIMTWDIKDNMDQEYFEFVVRRWVPTTSQLGLQMAAAWYTVYSASGVVPRIRAEGVAESPEKMNDILSSEEWHNVHEQLLEFVENYQHKIVETTGDFQM